MNTIHEMLTAGRKAEYSDNGVDVLVPFINYIEANLHKKEFALANEFIDVDAITELGIDLNDNTFYVIGNEETAHPDCLHDVICNWLASYGITEEKGSKCNHDTDYLAIDKGEEKNAQMFGVYISEYYHIYHSFQEWLIQPEYDYIQYDRANDVFICTKNSKDELLEVHINRYGETVKQKLFDDYIEETLSFIESNEIREHLRITNSLAGKRSLCTQIVVLAPAPLQKKITALRLIDKQKQLDADLPTHPEYEQIYETHGYDYTDWYARKARFALRETYEYQVEPDCDGEDDFPYPVEKRESDVFTLTIEFWSDKPYLYSTFDAAVEGMKELLRKESYDCLSGKVEITRWEHKPSGVLKPLITWLINTNSDIWYFYYPDHYTDLIPSYVEARNRFAFYDPLGDSLDIAVPFLPGDLIEVDQQPFVGNRRMVVLKEAMPCCGMYCSYMGADGIISTSSFNHNLYLKRREVTSPLSGLYRVARFEGELPEDEAPLMALSHAIKQNPKLAGEIDEYIDRNEVSHRATVSYSGVEWERLKTHFNL